MKPEHCTFKERVCSNGKGEEGELLLCVGIRVRGRIPKKKTVQSSITSMGFPLLQKPGEMCPGQTGRRVCKIPRLSSRKKQKFSRGFRGVSALEPEVTESAEFYTVSDEISFCSCYIS